MDNQEKEGLKAYVNSLCSKVLEKRTAEFDDTVSDKTATPEQKAQSLVDILMEATKPNGSDPVK
jgi:hypothetical protein